MESSSDSDDCQLYTRTAQNVGLKKKNLQERLEECGKIINLLPEEAENVLTKFENCRTDVCNHYDVLPITVEESGDELTLVTTGRNLRSRTKKPRNPKTYRPSTAKKQKTSQVPHRVNEVLSVSDTPIPVENINPSKRTRRRRNNSRTSNAGAIIMNDIITFDDDSEYPISLSPINFNRRKKSIPCSTISDEILGNSSLTNILITEDDESFEGDSLVTLTVEWNNGTKISRKEFKLRKYQKLQTVFEELANMEGLSTNRILLMHNFNSVRPSDTPSSLNFKYYGALTGSVSETEIDHNWSNLEFSNKEENSNVGLDVIKVKLQLETGKVLFFSVLKQQKIDVLYKMCCEELKCDESKIKINFDGEFVEPNDFLSELEVEDGDLFHVYIKS